METPFLRTKNWPSWKKSLVLRFRPQRYGLFYIHIITTLSHHSILYSPRGIIWSTWTTIYHFVGTTLTPIIMRSTLTTISTSNYEVLQHAEIAGYDLAYNKLRKMRKTIVDSNGTTIKDFTILTLVYKARNNARAYMNHYTDWITFSTQFCVTWSYSLSAKGLKNSIHASKLYCGS